MKVTRGHKPWRGVGLPEREHPHRKHPPRSAPCRPRGRLVRRSNDGGGMAWVAGVAKTNTGRGPQRNDARRCPPHPRVKREKRVDFPVRRGGSLGKVADFSF